MRARWLTFYRRDRGERREIVSQRARCPRLTMDHRASVVALGVAAGLFAGVFAYAQSYEPAAASGKRYVGSDACRDCHPDEFSTWKNALHVQMTKPIGEARIAGDFSPGTHLEQNG